MKQVEKLALVAIPLYFIGRVGSMMSMKLYRFGWSSDSIALLAGAMGIVVLALNIAIAIWLFRMAKQDNFIPWVWALFGFVFGVTGAILFFVYRIYEKQMTPANKRLERDPRSSGL